MNFTVYRSSAGSGKTFTLVKEYLKIALSDEHESPFRFKKILAITFTNKAAQEMKDRVIKALKELSAPEPGKMSPLAEILVAELGLDPFKLAARAENLLRAILHNYGDFAIGTIDSFTHRIVRTFAYDLGLPVNFEIETEKDELLQKAVDQLMNMIGADPGITETLVRFSEEKTDAEKGWQIESELKQTAEHLLKEEGTLYAERLRSLSLDDFKSIRELLWKLTSDFDEFVKSRANKAMQLVDNCGAAPADFSFSAAMPNWFKKIAGGDYETMVKPNTNVVKTLEKDQWASSKASKASIDCIKAIAPQLQNLYNEIREYTDVNYPEYATRSAVKKHLYSLAVLNELEKILRGFRDEDSVVHISEFNHIISKVVTEQPVPYIFEKLGARYSHFLVDEFQDTSVLQWENLLPLLENGLAENNFSMVVGDAKQAIYRWRSGDVEQFVALPKLVNKDENILMKDREQSLVRHYHEEELTKNFRSKKEVVDFNNELFLALADQLSSQYQDVYRRVAQEIKPGNTGGYVELRFPTREGKQEEINEQYVAESVALVQQLISEGWKKNEIALLVRKNDQGSLLATALIAAGIEVLSSDSLLVRNSPLVNCIVSLLRVLEHPEDDIALTDVAQYLARTKRVAIPLHEIKRNRIDLRAVLKSAGVDDDLRRISVLPIYQQCEAIVQAVFPGEQKNAWVIFFLDELLRFTATRNTDRQSFFAWWEDRSRNASVVIPEGTDAVNIMTVHKSKGLEFPVVILPFLDWKKNPQRNSELWVELEDEAVPKLEVAIVNDKAELKDSTVREQYLREMEKKVLDQMNVLYVACTRAVDQLYILSQAAPEKKGYNPDEEKDPTNVTKWFSALFSGQLNDEQRLIRGLKSIPERKADAKPQAGFIPLTSGEGKWTGKIRVRKYAEEAWDNNAVETARGYGILLHSLLQRVTAASEVPEILNDAVNRGLITSDQVPELEQLLNQVVNHPSLSLYFGGKESRYAETEILVPGDRSSRPDCVLVNGEEAVVIEYKSGAESEDHLHQVRHYKSLLSRMGYATVTAKLVYLDPLTVTDV